MGSVIHGGGRVKGGARRVAAVCGFSGGMRCGAASIAARVLQGAAGSGGGHGSALEPSRQQSAVAARRAGRCRRRLCETRDCGAAVAARYLSEFCTGPCRPWVEAKLDCEAALVGRRVGGEAAVLHAAQPSPGPASRRRRRSRCWRRAARGAPQTDQRF